MKRHILLLLAVAALGGVLPAASAEDAGNPRDQSNWSAASSPDGNLLWDRNGYTSTDMA